MSFKKKRRVRDLIRAALVILFFVGVPIWMFLIASIINSALLWLVFLLYICTAYGLCRRVDEWIA